MHQLQFANNFETKGVFLGERLFSDIYLKMRTFLSFCGNGNGHLCHHHHCHHH